MKTRLPFINMAVSCLAASEGTPWFLPRLQAVLVERPAIIGAALLKLDATDSVLRAKM